MSAPTPRARRIGPVADYPACVIVTASPRTVILPLRDEPLVLADTVNETGLSPCRGMLLVTVIHDTLARAVQTH